VVPGSALSKATNNSVPFDPVQTIINYQDFDFNTRNIAIGDPIDWSKLGEWNGTCWRDNAEGCGFTGWLHSVATPGAGSYWPTTATRIRLKPTPEGSSGVDSAGIFWRVLCGVDSNNVCHFIAKHGGDWLRR
jgi:hypothetical protein